MVARAPWFFAGAAALIVAGAAFVLVARRAPAPAEPGHAPAASASAMGPSRPAEAPPPEPSVEELALISPIAVGSDLGAFKVQAIHGVHDGVLRLVCVKEKATVRLDVALADPEGVVPPATAGKYAVFYSLLDALPEEGDRLAQQLARVLKPHGDMPAPRGMTTFKPREKPGVSL